MASFWKRTKRLVHMNRCPWLLFIEWHRYVTIYCVDYGVITFWRKELSICLQNVVHVVTWSLASSIYVPGHHGFSIVVMPTSIINRDKARFILEKRSDRQVIEYIIFATVNSGSVNYHYYLLCNANLPSSMQHRHSTIMPNLTPTANVYCQAFLRTVVTLINRTINTETDQVLSSSSVWCW